MPTKSLPKNYVRDFFCLFLWYHIQKCKAITFPLYCLSSCVCAFVIIPLSATKEREKRILGSPWVSFSVLWCQHPDNHSTVNMVGCLRWNDCPPKWTILPFCPWMKDILHHSHFGIFMSPHSKVPVSAPVLPSTLSIWPFLSLPLSPTHTVYHMTPLC